MGTNGSGDFLSIHATELEFPCIFGKKVELRKRSSCSLQLTNRSDQYVAFKVKTTNPRKYRVRPNPGVFLPGSISNVTVKVKAHVEMPHELQCKDKFLVRSVAMFDGAMVEDINLQTVGLFLMIAENEFNPYLEKEDGKVIGEFKLRVAYIPANPPSPVPEEPEEDCSPRSSMIEDEVKSSTTSEHVARSFEESTGRALFSEKASLLYEREMMMKWEVIPSFFLTGEGDDGGELGNRWES